MKGCNAFAPNENPVVTIFTFVHALFGVYFGYVFKGFNLNIQSALFLSFFIHLVFELWESTESGIAFFNNPVWDYVRKKSNQFTGKDLWCEYPGDTFQNSAADTIAFVAGTYLYYKISK